MNILIFSTQNISNSPDRKCIITTLFVEIFTFFKVNTLLNILNKGCSIYILFVYKNEFLPVFFFKQNMMYLSVNYLKLIMILKFHELFVRIWN